MNGTWTLLIATCGLLLLVACGCGSSTSVSGSVTYNGEPVASGSISFLPADGKGPTAGGTIQDGQYEIDELTPGQKIVRIVGVDKNVSYARSSEEMAQQADAAKKSGKESAEIEEAKTIPDNAEGNNEKIDVSSGVQTLDFSLLSPTSETNP